MRVFGLPPHARSNAPEPRRRETGYLAGEQQAPPPAPPPALEATAPGAPPEIVTAPRRTARDRLVILDLGELRTRAAAYDTTDGFPTLLGRVAFESAVGAGAPPDAFGARRGLRSQPGDHVAAPAVIATRADDPDLFAIGAPASMLHGFEALLAHDAPLERVEAIARAALFPFVGHGDRVRAVFVDGPNQVGPALANVEAAWNDTAIDLIGYDAEGGAFERRPVTVSAERLPAGIALLEHVCEEGLAVEQGAPVAVLDLGHHTSRLYLLDFDGGLLDLEVVPHGGASFLEHARRYAAERGWRTGGDVALLRQLHEGVELLDFGGMTFRTGSFFEDPRRELAKAVAAATASRLRRHAELGGRWPSALLLTGGPARALAPEIANRLTNRGLAIARTEVLAAVPPPLLAGAAALLERTR